MIPEFQGKYRFLSNFYLYPVMFDDSIYKSTEHAYQAAKTLDIIQRSRIQDCKTPGDAKRMGKRVALRPDWESVKLPIMLELLRKKFEQPPMSTALLGTGDQELVEGNYWNDTFWGVCNGYGLNHLGKLLMQVRDELRKQKEV